jgi:REP element-mobilizing transposase RayT
MKPLRRKLPRLERGYYLGVGAVHWIFSMEGRATGWLSEAFHLHFREMVSHTTVRYALVAPVYCLMPDHIHIMLWGYRDDSDAYLAASFLRKYTRREILPARYQKQAYDHVLIENELNRDSFEGVCHYILENPVRAKICELAREYPFSGSLIPGYPDLRIHEEGYWELFWKLVNRLATQPRA